MTWPTYGLLATDVRPLSCTISCRRTWAAKLGCKGGRKGILQGTQTKGPKLIFTTQVLASMGPDKSGSLPWSKSPHPLDPTFLSPSSSSAVAGEARIQALLVHTSPGLALNDPGMADAVQNLISEKGALRLAERSWKGEIGQGEWEVFHAPHFRVLSTGLLTTFNPIRYSLQGNTVTSNVRFSNPVIGEGWLSATGHFYAKDAYTIQVVFDKFWVDGVDKLHWNSPGPEGFSGRVPQAILGVSPLVSALTSFSSGFTSMLPSTVSLSAKQVMDFTAASTEHIINAAAQVLFPAFSDFPILYVSDTIAVFQFPATRSLVAVKKTAGESLMQSKFEKNTPTGSSSPLAAPLTHVVATAGALEEKTEVELARAKAVGRVVSAARKAAFSKPPHSASVPSPASTTSPASTLSSTTSTFSILTNVKVEEVANPSQIAKAKKGMVEESLSVEPELPSWEKSSLNGTWLKDEMRSDSEKELFDIMELSWVFAQAAKLLTKVNIKQDQRSFTIVTSAGMISVAEVYPLSGRRADQNRRDMRPGHCSGTVERVATPHLGVRLRLRFEGQCAGDQVEYFYLDDPNTFIREVDLKLDNGKFWKGKSVFTRTRY
mmetsp:Transcript_25601/g.35353  ORF Transcript_25601/g.35353 Transcript_25601/m.35353 type:complete len:602 (-) Transcript_25601:87-1892(-)|eukprot:CAMPEP_0196584862 /NCGR_PEP_ID=MMETSP1081-20130531/48756_1 /TAXON_ID=36882 /ORGANISM="Pyramimonas amylifera, Strain CCMP720" /LENGTH=601 /DNA_ID=CAMNT_0041906225 /DNA_START=60 /DNA_END=1865 /DNA_ORIENTATION=-